MVDAAGLAVSVVALANLFNDALDCFEYIQLGRSFGTNFQTSQLRFDNARLRLSRWGHAAGLNGDLKDVESLQATSVATEEIPEAERLLGQILDLFAKAEEASAEFKGKKRADDSSLVASDTGTDMDPVGRSLHDKMRNMSIKRQKTAGLKRKAKWALYTGENFRKLIEDVIKLVDCLVDTFPATRQTQRDLCGAEVSEIGRNRGLRVLQGIAASQDEDLEMAITNAMKFDVSMNTS